MDKSWTTTKNLEFTLEKRVTVVLVREDSSDQSIDPGQTPLRYGAASRPLSAQLQRICALLACISPCKAYVAWY